MATAVNDPGLDSEKLDSPFAWTEVKYVPGTSVVNPSNMLLDRSGKCIGIVTVLNACLPEIHLEVTRALGAASNPAKIRRLTQIARKEAEEYAAALEVAEARAKSAEQDWANREADTMLLGVQLEDAETALAAANARADEMQRDRAALSDKLNGTPCAEIRWREEREELMARIAELESTGANHPAYVWRDMKDVPKDKDVILYFSTGSCRVPLVARYEAGYLDRIGLENWRVVQPIPGAAPTGWLPLIWKD